MQVTDFQKDSSNHETPSPDHTGERRKFIDLFAGCGGLSLGLLNAGWNGLFAVERDSFAFSTLKANLISGNYGRQLAWPAWMPPQKMAMSTFLMALKQDARLLAYLHGVDLVAGGPPCQGFSLAGKRVHDDPRNTLFRDYLKVVSLLKPKVLLIENVRGILVGHGKKRTPFSAKIRRRLEKLGYATAAGIHRACEFGVPQERPRYVVIGVDRTQFPPDVIDTLEQLLEQAISSARLELLHEKGLPASTTVSVKDAIFDLQTKRRALEKCPDAKNRNQLRYKEPAQLTPYLACLRQNAPAQMNSMRLARHSDAVERKLENLIAECKSRNRRGVTLNPKERKPLKTKKRTVVVLNPRKPSHTLTTLPDDLLHYNEPRILTVREYARLQSFPDWFMFYGKYTTGGQSRRTECPRYTQVGNAVAPFVAEALGKAIGLFLDRNTACKTTSRAIC